MQKQIFRAFSLMLCLLPSVLFGTTNKCSNLTPPDECSCDCTNGSFKWSGKCDSDQKKQCATQGQVTNSFVTALSSSYIDDYEDSLVANTKDGCKPCGGEQTEQSLPEYSLNRIFNSRRAYGVWDFGLGQSSESDQRITFSEDEDGNLKAFIDTSRRTFPLMLDDGGNSDVRDGIFHDQLNATVDEMRLVDENGALVTQLIDAKYFIATDFSFNTLTFEVIQANGEFNGRLISFSDKNDKSIVVTYPEYSQAEIDADPALVWTKQSIKDAFNKTTSFTYSTQSYGGSYVITKVTLFNGAAINYEYTDTYLSKVTYPDGSFSTYDYSVNSEGLTVYHAETTEGKVKDVTFTSQVALDGLGGSILYNQGSMTVEEVESNGELFYKYFPSHFANYSAEYTGEGELKWRHVNRALRFYKDPEIILDEYGKFDFTSKEGSFESNFIDKQFKGNTYGAEFPERVNATDGSQVLITYDSNRRVASKGYDDYSFEAFSYNDLNQKTYVRDRLGRVSLNTYDQRGNLLTKEVGLLDTLSTISVPEGSESVDLFNVARMNGSVAEQSSTAAGGVAERAVDGHISGEYSQNTVTHTGLELNPWWQVTVPIQSEIDHVNIYNRAGPSSSRLNNFTVSAYNGTDLVWSEVYPGVADDAEKLTFTLPDGIVGDRVKVQLNSTERVKFSLAEVEVYASTVPGSEIAIQYTQTDAYAVYRKEYYPTGHANEFLMRYEWDANNNRLEYIYNANNQIVQINEPTDSGSGYQVKVSYTYDSASRISSSTDQVGRTTYYDYDERDRLVKTTYNDNSTELTFYGSGLTADLVVKKKDRNGNTSTLSYDNAARQTGSIRAYSVMNADGSSETVNPASLQSVTTKTYLSGQKVPRTSVTDGELTEYLYDYRMRLIETRAYPDANSSLITKKSYVNNRLFCQEDAYGRKTYYSYRAVDAKLVRMVKGTVPSFTLADYTAIDSLGRDYSNNADYLITDFELDAAGQRTATVDPRGIRHESGFDSRGRVTYDVRAAGSLNQISQREYDPNSNVISSIDPMGNTTEMAYGARNKLASRTVAAGSLVEATEYFTYYADGRNFEHTDLKGNTSTTVWHQCCGRLQANIDQEGHSQISNNDYYSNVTHTAVVEASGSITDYHDLPDGATVQEITTQYDTRHRPVARTLWLQPLGYVDPNNVPIADDPALGLTTHYLYYDEVDGHPELAPLLAELAADGIFLGAPHSAAANGSATIVINPAGEVQASIQDGVGRTVAQGALDKDDFANGTYTLVTWSTVINDTITAGGLLETQQVSALGFVNKSRSDGAGRTLEAEDAEGNIATREYDANSNVIKSRDANGVGQDCTFDDLNRDVQCADTEGSVVTKVFDLNNNLLESSDAKNQITYNSYDARNRKESTTDRLGGVTNFTYDANSNLVTISDALSKSTSYEFDARNLQTKVTYADGKSTTCDYDALRRKSVCTDQLGEKVEYSYDLAGRMTQRLYKLADDSVESTDTFTYDLASRPLTASKGRYNNTVSYTYDGIGRRKTETLSVPNPSGQAGFSLFTTTCAYDADNREVSCTYPNGDVVVKDYSDRNQLESLSFNAASIADFTYDNGLRESTRTFGNSIVSTKTYNADNTLGSLSSSSAEVSFDYTYDDNKNVTSETSNGTVMDDYSWTASFDAADRVSSWSRAGNNLPGAAISSQSWNLDLIGNWDSVTTDSVTENRTHNDVHELTDIDGQAATYDDKGNLLTLPGTVGILPATLTWDIDNHLSSVTHSQNGVTNFTYDAIGRRVSKNDTLFVSHGQRVIEEYTYQPSTDDYQLSTSYIHGTYVDDILAKVEAGSTGVPPVVHYYHTDRQYNVRGLTDASGNIVELYAYTVYGKQTVMDGSGVDIGATAHNNNYGFTGRYLDSETGLWYFRARYFSDELGRFVSRDPLGYVDGYSMYTGYFGAKFALDPSGNTYDLKTSTDTTANIIKNWGVRAHTGATKSGTIAQPYTFASDVDEIAETADRKCAWVVKASPIRLTVTQVLPSDAVASGFFSTSGEKAMLGHEARRVSVYVNADTSYLQPNELMGVNALRCGKVKHDTPGEAKKLLQAYLTQLRTDAANAAIKYIVQEQTAIGGEKSHGKTAGRNTIARKLGYKTLTKYTKIHKVANPDAFKPGACPK